MISDQIQQNYRWDGLVDTRLIATFGTLRFGSFTAAGAELHLVQSTVIAQIHALERELGAGCSTACRAARF
jgi:hypothetical protein